MTISIIIPTYNRADSLDITIKSFIEQNFPKEDLELIIVDNNSSDNTKQVIYEWIKKSDININYLFEARQGVHYARNTASLVAKGELLYFTDDDMLADPNLLKELVKVFENSENNIGSATGKVLPKWEILPPKWILKYCVNGILSLLDLGNETIIKNDDIGVYSCHQAIPKDIFLKSGGFNPENTAGIWIGDGETGLNIKIKNLGYKFAYCGKSVIYHMIPPQRLTQKYLNKRYFNQGNCVSYTSFREKSPSSIQLFKGIIIFILKLFKTVSICFYNFLRRNDTWRLQRARLSFLYARIRYDIRLITSESWRELVTKRNWLEI